jgi:hypothetical protein
VHGKVKKKAWGCIKQGKAGQELGDFTLSSRKRVFSEKGQKIRKYGFRRRLER